MDLVRETSLLPHRNDQRVKYAVDTALNSIIVWILVHTPGNMVDVPFRV